MAEPKTRPTLKSVASCLREVDDATMRADCRALAALMKRATGSAPKMWGAGIVGFGRYHDRYATGREGDWLVTGFSPPKRALTINIIAGFTRYGALLRKLGRHRTAQSCLYLNRLADVDPKVLEDLITRSVRRLKKPGGECG